MSEPMFTPPDASRHDAGGSTTDLSRISALQRGGDAIWHVPQIREVSYPEHGNAACYDIESSSFWFRHRNDCLVAVGKRFPPSGAIFDIGAGNGFVSSALSAAGFDTVAVEPGREGARNCVLRGLPCVAHATFEDAAFRQGSLPAVGLFDVLEHVEDDRGLLQSLATALCPGGLLYLTVPACNWLWSIDDVEAGHFRRYSLRTLTEAVTQAGMEVLYATYFFQCLVIPLLCRRTLPSVMGLRRKNRNRRAANEHRQPQGVAGRILLRSLNKEFVKIADGQRRPYGTSCLLVARKTTGQVGVLPNS